MKFDSGKEIRTRRKALGLTQEEVGKRLNLSGVAVGYWERNESEPTGTNLVKLAKILKCNPADLVGLNTDELSEKERFAEAVREAYLGSSEELQAAARRMFGIVEQLEKNADK